MTTPLAPRFGNLFVLGPGVRRAAEQKFDQRGQTDYLNYLYAETKDKAVQKNNLVVVTLPDERELLATDTKYGHKTEILAKLATGSQTPEAWLAYVEAAQKAKGKKQKVEWLA